MSDHTHDWTGGEVAGVVRMSRACFCGACVRVQLRSASDAGDTGPAILDLEDEATADLRAEVERLEREVASLAADLAVFTAEPGVLARVGSEHTSYWYNQTRLQDAENERLRAVLASADRLAKTAYGYLTDAQPMEGDDDISAALDALDRVRDVLDVAPDVSLSPDSDHTPEPAP